MSKIKSAKQLTFTYFSVVAFAIITIHFTVFETTVENLEHFTAQYRMEQIAQGLSPEMLDSDTVPLNAFTTAYVGFDNVPESLTVTRDLPLNVATEIYKRGLAQATDFFIMKVNVEHQGIWKDVYIVNSDPIFELSEDKAMKSQTNQLLLSFGLLILSLLVVLRISERLTSPLSSLVQQLRDKTKGDVSPLSLPETGKTVELVTLTDSINTYQAQISEMLERERAFNRFASHELRTPLMVMQGSLTLLEHSNDPDFVAKQRVRMSNAVEAMQEYVETLLSLTRDSHDEVEPWELTKAEIEKLAEHFTTLLEGNKVTVEVVEEKAPTLMVSRKLVGILIGNLIKNAFTYTTEGKVTITLTEDSVQVADSGIGLQSSGQVPQGYGLGLVIANEIARKHHWQISLDDNEMGGCTAQVIGLSRT
ncbi:two-component system sensor protein [Grimontia indica]|uniref:histidine kinase n=1 Tax=Grimontia indica TaxID=1056512 RepID=R1IJI1_9GAMM|nr:MULTISPECIES: HAMP domain-containing sensor histidine kinase [Grimontia]EOD77652.1 two-component system sensor protein [Grimontia indica]